MKRNCLIVIMVVAMVFIFSCFAGCKKIDIKEYPAVDTEFRYSLDDSIKFCDLNSAPLDNQNRGFRGETYITLGTDEAYPNSGENYVDKLEEQLSRHGEQDIKILQVYVYLIEYYNTDIPQSALEQLKSYFELLKSKNVKILLRFAYETSEGQKQGPRTRNIERHCSQLKTFISQNRQLFDDVVYAVQLGMIGLWGEGHGSVHRISVRRVIEAVADMVPEEVPIMVRTPEMLTQVPDNLEKRFSVHDDYLLGYDHEWGMMDWQSPEYPKLLTKCKYTITDGELPWGRSGIEIDLKGLVGQCVGYGLTTLSIEHNYNEEEDKIFALEKAKSEYIDKEFLDSNHYPYNPNLLTDGKISIFDYLKYHLGYQLVASNLKIQSKKASFMLTNFGFASPYYYDMKVYVDGKEVKTYEEFDSKNLLQFGQSIFTFDYEGGDIEIELFNKRDNDDKIRLYNDIEFIDGKNVIFRS